MATIPVGEFGQYADELAKGGWRVLEPEVAAATGGIRNWLATHGLPSFATTAEKQAAAHEKNIANILDWAKNEAGTTAGVKKPSWSITRPWKNIPKKVKWGLGLAGPVAFAVNAMTGDSVPAQDWSKVVLPSSGTTTTDLNKWLANQTKIINDAYGQALPAYPGAEMYDPMSVINSQLGQASSASMADLAKQYGSAAANIKQLGTTGAASINDIYGSGATAMEQIAAQPTSGYDAMVPVSGDMAVAPDQQRAAGASLADFLGKNQLISAQQQGGMAELAQMLGPAYSNQYALIDAQMRAQAEANKARVMAEREYQRQQEKNQALTELQLRVADQSFKQANQPTQSLITPTMLDAWASEWNSKMSDRDKQFYAAQEGITNAQDWALRQARISQQLGQ